MAQELDEQKQKRIKMRKQPVGELDPWNFNAEVGDRVWVDGKTREHIKYMIYGTLMDGANGIWEN